MCRSEPFRLFPVIPCYGGQSELFSHFDQLIHGDFTLGMPDLAARCH